MAAGASPHTPLGGDLRPHPTEGAYSAPQTPVAGSGKIGLPGKGRNKEEDGKGKGKKRMGGKERRRGGNGIGKGKDREEKGRERAGGFPHFFLPINH